ncbi:MAG: site-specific integrase [Anaerohalosphaeraceae bacterium]
MKDLLSGSIYARNGRWYWKFKKPGEDKYQTCPLRLPRQKVAVKDRRVAVELANMKWIGLVNQKKDPTFDGTIKALTQRYTDYAKTYYVNTDGKSTDEVYRIKHVCDILNDTYRVTEGQVLVEKYGSLPVEDFTPPDLRSIQKSLVDKKTLCRKSINKIMSYIKRIFEWGVGEQYVPAMIWHGLLAVKNLKKGRTTAKDYPEILPVDWDDVEAVLPYVPPIIADMIRLQWHTGMRTDEVCQVRPGDIDTSGQTWYYRPEHHKTQHLGQDRIVPLGTHAQAILRPYLLRGKTLYCFCPVDTMQRYGRSKISGKRLPRMRYTRDSYARAIKRAFFKMEAKKILFKTKWTPYQLRHAAATRLRDQLGIEYAAAMLGHKDVQTTMIYANLNKQKMEKAAQLIG